MRKLSLDQSRKEFLDFFKTKEHYISKSYPLVPKNDKSLLLINAGMAPLKPYFLGTEKPPKKRMSTCQKCIRTGDIENVGKTDRHGTFFEMLGNFSFGDYFKEETIKWAWEFFTEVIGISEEILWVSVYKDDDEAYKIWNEKIGIPKERIVRLGKEDNFWELEIGPCGPCSEIYIDRGEKYGCGQKDCKPGCECDRYVEVWNLVFSQFDKDEDGNYNKLPNPNIDTGMGLERLVTILNGASNIFEIEPIKTILNNVEKISGLKYGDENKSDVSIRVITDHIRAMTFMVADGIIPSNEGRGYVLRRLIRRASRHGKLIGISGKFLFKLTDVVIDNWYEQYPELKEKEAQIKKIIEVEEEKFQETIDSGLDILKQYIEEMEKRNEKQLDGKKAFKLYDTYGFPIDLTKEILKEVSNEEEYTVNIDEFNIEMEKQRQRAREARQNSTTSGWDSKANITIENEQKTEFVGYDNLVYGAKILGIIKENLETDYLQSNDEGIIVLDKTPFYAESGGQVGDIGVIKNKDFTAKVKDTKKGSDGKILHFVKITRGKVSKNDEVEAIVLNERRSSITRNHSATHLLHRALRNVLGEHVNQAGSLVNDERLRFDFTHFEALNEMQLSEIEQIVNRVVFEGLDVVTMEKDIDEAKKMGATALFGEKYGDIVRVVKMGDFSVELCGGTHVSNTSKICMFKIISESGIASGVRRIEAITGEKVYEYINNKDAQLNNIADIIKSNKSDILNKVKNLSDENKNLAKEVEKLKSKLASSKLDDIINEVNNIDGINVVVKRIDGMDINNLRQLGDKIKDRLNSVLVVLGTVNDGKVNFIATTTKDLVSKGIHAGNIIREVAKVTGGGGGGRPDMAQAGGKDSSKVDEALSIVNDLVLNNKKSF